MPEGIRQIKDGLAAMLNPSIFSWDSAEGVIVTVIAIVIIYKITKNMADFVGWLIGALFLIQLCHVLGFTVLNDYFPFRDLFRYDVLTAIAQLFVGTPIADGILWVSGFVNYIAKVVTDAFVQVAPGAGRVLDAFFRNMPWDEISVP